MTDRYAGKLTSAAEAVKAIRSGDGVYLHSNAGVPRTLLDAMVARCDELRDVHVYHLITLGAAPHAAPEWHASFHVHALFIGHNTRAAVADGRADYTPVFFSDLPSLFRQRMLPIDVCMVQVSEPDEHGNMSYGLALDCTPAAMESARIVIAEVNKQTPRTFGSHQLNVRDATFIVEADYPLPELVPEQPGPIEISIGRNVADYVEDGATIQLGIGAIPNGVLRALAGKRELGVHSEMVSDGILELIESGVITNSRKTVVPGKCAVTFMFGSQHLYKFVANNPFFEFHATEYINDPFVIAQNYKMTAINSALQIDLTGQVCADSLGTNMYSGFGGQLDFVRGSRRAPGGKAIIALPSTAKGDAVSRIVPTITEGGGVVTTRADVQYVATEYGVVNLAGMNMKDRVRALLSIAHPKFQAELEEKAYATYPWLGKRAMVV